MKEKVLILIRHAYRDKIGAGAADSGLSAPGKEQAVRLASHFKKRLDYNRCSFMTSPRLRCRETIEIISNGREVMASPLLGEGPDLSGRAEKFLHWFLDEGPNVVVGCSHGDWIPAFFSLLFGHDIALKNAAYIEVEFLGLKPVLVNLVQEVG